MSDKISTVVTGYIICIYPLCSFIVRVNKRRMYDRKNTYDMGEKNEKLGI
jgi:hypothetical protein